ncbi:hypothetical protein XENORESO_011607 [Xenotaenia resolanae]|uniref:Uncharacterized protein n=1 Tax=Xenotaenia resolanae TaxID=208358 RepID=A0ABV0VQB8_9TELE
MSSLRMSWDSKANIVINGRAASGSDSSRGRERLWYRTTHWDQNTSAEINTGVTWGKELNGLCCSSEN